MISAVENRCDPGLFFDRLSAPEMKLSVLPNINNSFCGRLMIGLMAVKEKIAML